MEQKVVRQMETEIEEAVAKVIGRLQPPNLPLLPSPQTVHLMAKAAVTVYETAVENQRTSLPKR